MTPEEKKERKRENDRRYRERHKEEIRARRKEYDRKYLETHKAERVDTQRKYREKNRETINQTNRERYKENPQIQKERTARYYQKNPHAKIRNRFVSLVGSYAVRAGYAGGKTALEMLGCDFETFLAYIQDRFDEGMSFQNNGIGDGKWNFDHITPICSAKTDEEFEQLNHYTNFQPLWSKDNLRKGKRMP